MTVLAIIQERDPVLRRVAADADPMDPHTADLARDMIETLHAYRGVGLAAPQVSASVRLIVLTFGKHGPDMALVNPVIVKRKGSQICHEGCLSVIEGKRIVRIRRSQVVWVEFNTPGFTGRETQKFKGLMASAAQHEIDHLDGKLILDYA